MITFLARQGKGGPTLRENQSESIPQSQKRQERIDREALTHFTEKGNTITGTGPPQKLGAHPIPNSS
jgi:hypothetical protein